MDKNSDQQNNDIEKKRKRDGNSESQTKRIKAEKQPNGSTSVETNKGENTKSDLSNTNKEKKKKVRAKVDVKQLESKVLTTAGSNWQQLLKNKVVTTNPDGPKKRFKRTFGKSRKNTPQKEEESKVEETTTETSNENSETTQNSEISTNAKLTRVLSLQCDYVQTGVMVHTFTLRRVIIMNYANKLVYNKTIATDKDGQKELKNISKDVSEMIKDRVIVGYNLEQALECLDLPEKHPKSFTRDLLTYEPLHAPESEVPLRKLVLKHLQRDDKLNTLEDRALACLEIYKKVNKKWEQDALEDVKKRKQEREERFAEFKKTEKEKKFRTMDDLQKKIVFKYKPKTVTPNVIIKKRN